jgi:signal transduction histidine kinase
MRQRRGESLVSQTRKRRQEAPRGNLPGFEKWIAELAVILADLPADRIPEHIQGSLQHLAEHLAVDRVELLQWSMNQRLLRTTHLWSAADLLMAPLILPMASSSRMRERLNRGAVLRASNSEALPGVLGEDSEDYRHRGVRSLSIVPLTASGASLGALVLSTFRSEREWPDELASLLQILGQLYADALARHASEREEKRVGQLLALGEMATALAHELKQPLAAILANAQAAQRFLANDAPDLGEIREILADIGEADQLAVGILSRVRAEMGGSTPDLLPINLNELIQEVVDSISGDMRHHRVRVELELDPAQPWVRGDVVHLQQALLNLMRNAVQAMESTPLAERRLTLRTGTIDGTVEVAVQDRGCGIPEDRLSQIFKSFFTTKPSGMGIGLTVTRSVVELHDGRLWATNNTDRGATLHFTLPILEEGLQ